MNSLSHTVGYKNHSVGYIFHSAGYKNHTVEQNCFLKKKQYAYLHFYLYHTMFSSLPSIARTALIIPFSFSKTFFSLKSREKNKKIRYIYHKELL